MAEIARPYRQIARAVATDDTRRRIVAAFEAALQARPMEDITLDGVAAEAGTTRQTVIRLFGGKEGLMTALTEKLSGDVRGRRSLPERATPAQAVRAVVADYEAMGDFIIRVLAQEESHPVLGIWLNTGRAKHRAWIGETFGHALPPEPPRREAVITQIVIAADVYTWKLLRRDFQLSVEQTEALMAGMIVKLLQGE